MSSQRPERADERADDLRREMTGEDGLPGVLVGRLPRLLPGV